MHRRTSVQNMVRVRGFIFLCLLHTNNICHKQDQVKWEIPYRNYMWDWDSEPVRDEAGSCTFIAHRAYVSVSHTWLTKFTDWYLSVKSQCCHLKSFLTIKLLLSNWHFFACQNMYKLVFAVKFLLTCMQACVSCFQTENQITVLSTSWSSDECLFGTMFILLCTSA